MHARLFVVVGILACAPSALAQEAGPRSFTLEDARAYARAHQPSVRAALLRIEAAKEAANVPRAQWLPQFGATAQIYVASANNTTAGYVSSRDLDIPRIGSGTVVNASSATFQPYGSTFAAVGVGQEVFDFGRIAAQSAAADALVDVARHGSDATRLDVDFGVEESFYAVLAAKGVLVASEQAYERTREHRDFARAGVASGMYAPINLTRAEADLAHFDIGRIRARGGVKAAQALLSASVGTPDAMLDANGALPTTSDVPTLSAALEQAAARDPRVAEALARFRAQSAHTRAIFAEMRPNLFGSGTFSGRAGGAPPSGTGAAADYNGWLPTVPNWDVGLVFSWPIYDGTIVARAHASAAQAEALREDVEAFKQVLAANVQRAYIAVEIARDTIPGLERAQTAAVANYVQADARFKAGVGTAIEVADAEALRTQADIDLAFGRFELARSRAAFGRAVSEGLGK